MLRRWATATAKIFVVALSIALVVFPSVVSAQNIYQQLQTPFYDPSSGTSSDSSCTLPDVSGSDSETAMWNFLIGQPGMTPVAAAGLMGNFESETAGTWNPRVNNGGDLTDTPESNTVAYGIAQWLGGRQDELVKNATAAGVIPGTLSLQLDFVMSELNGTYKSSVLGPIEAATTTDEAAQIVFASYEIAGDSSLPARQTHAANVLIQYGSTTATNPSASTTPPSDCGSSSTVTTTSSNCQANGIVYAPEYSQAQLTQIFGDPGTATSHPAMDANLTTTDFDGHQVTANKLLVACLQAVANDIKANGLTYPITSVGCYRFDSDNGGSNIGLLSYHTYGAACDIDPLTNNYYDTANDGTQPYDPNCPPAAGSVDSGHCYSMPPQLVQIFASHGFYWGGDYHTKKDYMHFEFHGIDPNNPNPQPTPQTSTCSTGQSVVATAVCLSWPATHSPSAMPTAAYQAANSTYNKQPSSQTDAAILAGSDCGVFVSTVMRMSGVDPNYPLGADNGTEIQQKYVLNSPNYQIIRTNASTPLSVLKPGDILIVNKGSGAGADGHTLIYLGDQSGGSNIAQASWSSTPANASMPYLTTLSSLSHSFESGGSAYFIIARHK